MSTESSFRPGDLTRASGGATQAGTSSGAPTAGSATGRSTNATEAASTIAEAARRAGSEAQQAFSSVKSEVNQKAKGFLDQQVAVGADLAHHVADSVRTAAENLDRNSPRLAGMVRSAADKVDEVSSNLREQSLNDILRTSSDFTRRQPALVFGLASLAGFFLFRVLKSSPSSPSGNYRAAQRSNSRSGQFHDT